MKLKFLLFAFVLLIVNMIIPNEALSQKKYYIIFDNFEDQQIIVSTSDGAAGTTITNLFDLCYWDHLREDLILGKYFEKKPFNANTFMDRDITDYDVAVFVMGTKFGLNTSVDGIKVLDKIKQMLAANKSVVIIGHAVLPLAFGGQDSETKEWLSSYMGIKEAKVLKLLNGNTLEGFRVDGIEGDPVSSGFRKVCNRIYEENNAGQQSPIRWYPEAFFVTQLEGGKNAKAFDYVKEAWGSDIQPGDEQLIAGVRTEDGKARCIFYPVNFDIVSGTHLLRYRNSLSRGIRWAVRDVPSPEGFLVLEQDVLDFGVIEPNQKGYLSVNMQNDGREDLHISKFEINNFEPEGSFLITEGNQAVTLKPGGVHQLNIMFSPTEQREYEDYITVVNDGTGGDIALTVKGQGGAEVFNGPRLALTDMPVDFGTVPYGQYSDVNVAINNIGNIALIVNTVVIADDGGGHFTFSEPLKTPITIPPGKTHYVRVRYTSIDEEYDSFQGRLEVTSNGLGSNKGEGEVVLKGRSTGKNTNSGVTLSSTNIDFGVVDINNSEVQTLTITNTGSNNLRFFTNAKWDNASGGENIAQFKFLDDSDKNIPILEPGESHDLIIEFTPQAEKNYAVTIQMLTNDPMNEGLIEVPVSGKGNDPVSVANGKASIEGLELTINPSPVNTSAKIQLEIEKPGTVEMNIVDISGRKVANLMNRYVDSGITLSDFNAQNYANGMYFIVVQYNGNQTQLPFTVAK